MVSVKLLVMVTFAFVIPKPSHGIIVDQVDLIELDHNFTAKGEYSVSQIML